MKKLVVGLLASLVWLQGWCAGYPLYVEAVKEEDGVWAITAHNAGKASVFLSVSLKNRVNVRIGGMSSGSHKALEPGAKETLLLAIAEKQEEKMQFEYETRWVFGRGINRADHSGLYRPPFPADMTFDTINSASGETTEGRLVHSVDILMPEGTPVIAARTGHIMDVSGEAPDFKRGEVQGVWPFYDDKAKMGSYVRIVHDDGTWAEYLHMKTGSITVKTGQFVEAGTQLGESGQSGMAARPHLQFRVMRPGQSFGLPESVPIRMELAGRGQVLVKAGDTIGASLSVAPEPETTRNDPLVVATVKKVEADANQGVYSLGRLVKASGEQSWMLLALASLAMIGGLGWGVKRARTQGLDWPQTVTSLMSTMKRAKKSNKEVETDDTDKNAVVEDTSTEEPTEEKDLRPKAGYLLAEWERQFVESVSLGMPIGYEIHTKVSLNRLLSRPLWISKNPHALALVRGEALDMVLVRTRDHKIMGVLELERDRERIEAYKEADRAKKEMLTQAGIKVVLIKRTTGASEIGDILKRLAPNEISSARLATQAITSI